MDCLHRAKMMRSTDPLAWTTQQTQPVAPPRFCSRGGSDAWVYRRSRVRSPPVPVVLSVYRRGSLLDGLAMYLSRDTKKFHDNESTHILHNFWTSTHRGGKLPAPLAAPLNATLIAYLSTYSRRAITCNNMYRSVTSRHSMDTYANTRRQ